MNRLSKRDLVNCLIGAVGGNPVNTVMVDEFESYTTRHICHTKDGNPFIGTLSSSVFNIPTEAGCIGIQYMCCPICRKLIVDKSSLEFI